MPRFRPSILALLLTLALLLFLWLPPLQLYGEALWRVLWHQPARLIEALPLQPLQRFLFLNTLALCASSAAFALLFGIPVGAACARGPHRLRNVFTVLCILPLALPPMLAASAWLEITRTPPARSMASLAAKTASPLPPVLVASLVLALCFFPIVALWLRAVLMGISPDIEDAARSLGSEWTMWQRVLVPLLWPALAGAMGLVCALAMWEMGAPDLLDARTYSVEIYRQLNAGDNLDVAGKYTKVALEGVPMLFLGLLALWPAARALRRFDRYGAATHDSWRSDTSTRRESRLIIPWAVLVLLLSPGAVLGVFLSQLRPLNILWESWASNDVEIINTMRLATLGALFITAMALLLVPAWRAWPSRLRQTALTLCVAPLLVAPILLGVALINFWNRPGLSIVYGDWPLTGITFLDQMQQWVARDGMMLIGYVARFAPLAILLLYEAVRRIDNSQIEAAQNLGANSSHIGRTIILPLLAPAALATYALLWALCGGELSTSVLINQPGGQTLPVPIFNQMHIGSTAEVAALSLTLFALCGGALLLATVLIRFLLRHITPGR
ncbi:MAG TPA: ABC transporter permease subunit [Abditibacteriaceae bacterium]